MLVVTVAPSGRTMLVLRTTLLDAGETSPRDAARDFLFIARGRAPSALQVSVQPWSESFAERLVLSYDRLVPPNAFARWLERRT